jgi:mannose-6-phosphate isomerase-like protein (cupin superfamily)
MGNIAIRHWEDIDPTLFMGRESRRIITPEKENATKFSIHRIHRYAGLSNEIFYPINDEALYIIEGEGFILEGDKKTPIRSGCCVFIPAGEKYKIFNVVPLIMMAVLSPPRSRDEWKDRKDLVQLENPVKK